MLARPTHCSRPSLEWGHFGKSKLEEQSKDSMLGNIMFK